MLHRFIRFRPLTSLSTLSTVVLALGFAGCEGSVPEVRGKDLVIPDRAPSRAVQALSTPSTSNTDGGSNSDVEVYCLDGETTVEEYNEDGSFVTEFDCGPGGGIDRIRNEGTGDELGNGSYDQITFLEDGTSNVWHFTYATSEDFLTTSYTGVSDDGSEDYVGVYTSLDAQTSELHEEWNLDEGSYVTDGVMSNDGLSFDGIQTFDDPATEASPDWTSDSVSSGNIFSQEVHFVGEGFVSDYTYDVGDDGNVSYDFATDIEGTQVNPDYAGSYAYAADGSGTGSYTQLFDDGSELLVSDVMNADGSVVESWTFDDEATEQAIDQEGSMTWNADGSAEGSVTNHIVGGGDQTCAIHVSADGVQTIDECT